ncbi:3-oxoacyl-ACP synthase III [Candidatus Woesearchaeota archaeon]|jgi:3-oxoacyl-[acyl-carrier-protein] synthase-3|nr:3-oxoacyl-ACP synthase III [Candidatus Woesearchaeota archaeon]
MRYSKVYLDSMGYELGQLVVTSQQIEERLAPLYEKLNIPEGQIEAWTGVKERRWWEPGYPTIKGSISAAKKALAASNVRPEDIGTLIYTSVFKTQLEPATACNIGADIGVSPDATMYDISNACLAAVNGIIEIANKIELGQIKAGMVVSCETSPHINELTIKQLLENPRMDEFIRSAATFTGGSGASAVILTDGSFSDSRKPQLLGGVACTDPQFNDICRWEMEPIGNGKYQEIARTDAPAVLNNGVRIGERTWQRFKETLGWTSDDVDKTICHQVARKNQEMMRKTMGVTPEQDFDTYPFLGNIGSVSLPITAAIANERGFLKPGDKVVFGGIGSGLNCLILGWQW